MSLSVGCQRPADIPAVTISPETTQALETNVTFSGTDLVILQRSPNETHYKEIYLQAEEITGEPLNDAIYKRNTIIEEKYGVNFVHIYNADPHKEVSLAVAAQTDEYDIAFPKMRLVNSTALSGHLYNLNDLPYVDFTKSYWDSNFVNDITLNGKLYAIVSDISLMTLLGTRGIIFNQSMIEKNNLVSPYDLVENNQWTLDKFIELASSISGDLNGDQQYTEVDMYGLLSETSNFRFFVIASGVDIFIQNDKDDFFLGFMNEKTVNIINKLHTIYDNTTHTISYESLKGTEGATKLNSNWKYGRQLFSQGQILFLQNGASTFPSIIEFGMKDEFGIVPNPKYDLAQTDYYHMPDYDTTVLVIPSTNDDYDRLGILLEDLAFYSNQLVLPAYYDNVIKTQYAPSPKLGEMLDIIKDNISYHYGLVYDIDVNTALNKAAFSENISSTFAEYENIITTKLNGLIQTINKLP